MNPLELLNFWREGLMLVFGIVLWRKIGNLETETHGHNKKLDELSASLGSHVKSNKEDFKGMTDQFQKIEGRLGGIDVTLQLLPKTLEPHMYCNNGEKFTEIEGRLSGLEATKTRA